MSFSDENNDYAVKEVHMTNLRKIVEYCENVVDCRRSLQLNYFAEHFTSEQCLENPRTACDNCLKKEEFKVCLLCTSSLFQLIPIYYIQNIIFVTTGH